jgi:DNA/RNA-binding domain of Phe-tRNA-synthetase-like protein
VSIEQVISLGAHDLSDIRADLEVRYSKSGDMFLPFGATEYENVDVGELIFTSGNVVQTRKWIWRQSELGKTTVNSKNVIFQLVGFDDKKDSSLSKAMTDIESLIVNRFQGACKKYIVDYNNISIDF